MVASIFDRNHHQGQVCFGNGMFFVPESTEHPIQVRSALSQLYLEKQQCAVVSAMQTGDALGLHIEFDETGQKLRLKKSWSASHITTLSVLASRLQLVHHSAFKSDQVWSFTEP